LKKAILPFVTLRLLLVGIRILGIHRFSSPDEVLDALKYAGFDIINVANNHMLDRGVFGLRKTLEQNKKGEDLI